MTENDHSDQWRRGGICDLCRRKNYCQKVCRAKVKYADARLKEYIRRRTGIDKIQGALHPDGKEMP